LEVLQADTLKGHHLFERKQGEREHWEGEYHQYFQEVQRLNLEGEKNHRATKELNELVQHLKETGTVFADEGTTSTQTLVTVQRELESKRAELAALKLTLDTVDADLAIEQINHRGTRDTLLTSQNHYLLQIII